MVFYQQTGSYLETPVTNSHYFLSTMSAEHVSSGLGDA